MARTGMVPGKGLQFTMDPEVHLQAKELGVEITSDVALDVRELVDKKKDLRKAQVAWDEARVRLNTLEGQVDHMTIGLRLRAIKKGGA